MIKVVAALALILAAAGPAQAQSLDEVVRDVETAYGRITDLRAEFSQSSFNKSLNQTIPAKGTVYLKKGGKLRWEYTEPMKFTKMVVNSGLPERTFTFVAPKGVAIVPLR